MLPKVEGRGLVCCVNLIHGGPKYLETEAEGKEQQEQHAHSEDNFTLKLLGPQSNRNMLVIGQDRPISTRPTAF